MFKISVGHTTGYRAEKSRRKQTFLNIKTTQQAVNDNKKEHS